jgi:hypothetical protein
LHLPIPPQRTIDDKQFAARALCIRYDAFIARIIWWVAAVLLNNAVGAVCLQPVKDGLPFAASMSVISPGPVSDHVEIEIRIACRNHDIRPADFAIAVDIEPQGASPKRVFDAMVQVAGNDQQLASKRVRSADFVGVNTIRFTVTGPNGFAAMGSWPLQVASLDTRALKLLQFLWIDPGAVPPSMTEADLRQLIDKCGEMGVRGFIITYPDYTPPGFGAYYPSRVLGENPNRASFDIVGTILNQAAKNSEHVFVGVGWGTDALLTWDGFENADRKRATLTRNTKVATELWTLYGKEKSFYGWYLTHEANDIARASDAYYNAMSDFLHSFEADKPVLISPAGTPIVSKEILSTTKVDIVAYQDAVGAGYVPYRYTYDPEQRMQQLEEVYKAYEVAHCDSGKHLWSNLEIWEMDGPEYKDAHPANFEGVIRQLHIESKHVDTVTAYQLVGYMSPQCGPSGDGRAVDLFKRYRASIQPLLEKARLEKTIELRK